MALTFPLCSRSRSLSHPLRVDKGGGYIGLLGPPANAFAGGLAIPRVFHVEQAVNIARLGTAVKRDNPA